MARDWEGGMRRAWVEKAPRRTTTENVVRSKQTVGRVNTVDTNCNGPSTGGW